MKNCLILMLSFFISTTVFAQNLNYSSYLDSNPNVGATYNITKDYGIFGGINSEREEFKIRAKKADKQVYRGRFIIDPDSVYKVDFDSSLNSTLGNNSWKMKKNPLTSYNSMANDSYSAESQCNDLVEDLRDLNYAERSMPICTGKTLSGSINEIEDTVRKLSYYQALKDNFESKLKKKEDKNAILTYSEFMGTVEELRKSRVDSGYYDSDAAMGDNKFGDEAGYLKNLGCKKMSGITCLENITDMIRGGDESKISEKISKLRDKYEFYKKSIEDYKKTQAAADILKVKKYLVTSMEIRSCHKVFKSDGYEEQLSSIESSICQRNTPADLYGNEVFNLVNDIDKIVKELEEKELKESSEQEDPASFAKSCARLSQNTFAFIYPCEKRLRFANRTSGLLNYTREAKEDMVNYESVQCKVDDKTFSLNMSKNNNEILDDGTTETEAKLAELKKSVDKNLGIESSSSSSKTSEDDEDSKRDIAGKSSGKKTDVIDVDDGTRIMTSQEKLISENYHLSKPEKNKKEGYVNGCYAETKVFDPELKVCRDRCLPTHGIPNKISDGYGNYVDNTSHKCVRIEALVKKINQDEKKSIKRKKSRQVLAMGAGVVGVGALGIWGIKSMNDNAYDSGYNSMTSNIGSYQSMYSGGSFNTSYNSNYFTNYPRRNSWNRSLNTFNNSGTVFDPSVSNNSTGKYFPYKTNPSAYTGSK